MTVQEIKDLLEEVSGEVPKIELIPDSVDYNILSVSLPKLGVKVSSYQDSQYPLDSLQYTIYCKHFNLLKLILLKGIEKIKEGN